MDGIDLSGETPTELIPKMGEFPVSNSAFYQQLIMTEAIGGSAEGEELNEAIDPFSIEPPRTQHPTTGVMLTFEQGWFQEGLALGELRKSLSLAPGEVTKLAVVDWRRQSRTSDKSARTEVDIAAASTDEGTNVESVQRGVANQTQRGDSFSMGSASHFEAGGSFGGLFASASASGGHSSHMGFAASSSTGTREVAAEAAKNVQRNTEQMAQSTRSSRATQVIEVSESEQQSTTTRVVANYNHAHALTMQYFEVLQIYSLRTKVVRADRCVFIPMEPLDFQAVAAGSAAMSDATVELLREVLTDFGATALDNMVADFHEKAPTLTKQIADIQAQMQTINEELAGFPARLNAAAVLIAEAQGELQAVARSAPSAEIDMGLFTIPNPALAIFNASTLGPAQTRVEEAMLARNRLLVEQADASRRLTVAETNIEEKRFALSENTRLFGILAKYQVFLNQQMWMRIDGHQWHRKLAGRTFPHGEYEGQEIGGLIDPKPLGYFGNYIAFAWDFPVGMEQVAEDYEDQFTSRTSTSTRIALPTEGVFGEAVLGQANSAEKIDITRFWNWQDSPIPILPPSLTPVSSQSRAGNLSVAPPLLDFGPAVAKLRELGMDADVSDDVLIEALRTSTGGEQARLIGAAAAAGITAANNASDGAGRAGQRSIDAMKNTQDFIIGLANSEAGKLAVGAVAAGATGGASTVGGLLNAAGKASKVIDLAAGASKSTANTKETAKP